MADTTQSSPASNKWAPELQVIENIIESLVLPDAKATSIGVARGSGLGFTGTEVGGIRFDGREADEGDYRGASEEHAVKFAKRFNDAFLQTNANGQVVGSLTNKDIARVEGNVVTFELPELRKLLGNHTIADQLPGIAKSYSKSYIIEKSAAQVDQLVEGTIAERKMEKVQTRIRGEVLKHVAAIVEESPEETTARLEELTITNPQLAQNVRATYRSVIQSAGEYLKNPESIEDVQDDFRPVVERAAERLAERAANDLAAKEGAEVKAAEGAAEDKAPDAAGDEPKPGTHASKVTQRRAASAEAETQIGG